MSDEKVSFESGGCTLVGRLYKGRPDQSGIIVTGSWTTVKEQMAELYARKLADQGFNALVFDFQNFGESGGDAREYESPSLKISDIEAASRYLASRDNVAGDSVGALAICASAGYAAAAIANGAPISSFATVAAWLQDPSSAPEVYDGAEGVGRRTKAGKEALARYEASGEIEYVPAYDEKDPEAAMGAMVKAYYGDPKVGAVPEWTNRFALMSWPEWLGFDALASAPDINVPMVMVHSEKAAFPNNVRRFADNMKTRPDVLWREGAQIDFYHKPAQVDPAIETVASHFRKTLSEARA